MSEKLPTQNVNDKKVEDEKKKRVSVKGLRKFIDAKKMNGAQDWHAAKRSTYNARLRDYVKNALDTLRLCATMPESDLSSLFTEETLKPFFRELFALDANRVSVERKERLIGLWRAAFDVLQVQALDGRIPDVTYGAWIAGVNTYRALALRQQDLSLINLDAVYFSQKYAQPPISH
jgi:hypothetical protein